MIIRAFHVALIQNYKHVKAILFLLLIVLNLKASAQAPCEKVRPLTDKEKTYQQACVDKLTGFFHQLAFTTYQRDDASPLHEPAVWTEVCSDRKAAEPFQMNGFYTYAVDPAVAENANLLQRINSVDYSNGERALDELRNLGNQIRLICEVGYNITHLELKNVGKPIAYQVRDSSHLFFLTNSRKDDSKDFDIHYETLVVKGQIKITDKVTMENGLTIYSKIIELKSIPQPLCQANTYVLVTGGKEIVHQELKRNFKNLLNQL